MQISQTPLLVAFNLFLLILMFVLMRGVLIYPYRICYTKRRLSIFIALIFVLFSFWGTDWFHYFEDFPELKNGYSGHMEDVYVFIAQKLSIGYISFRVIIWGTALLMYCLLINRLQINKDLALFFFLCCWLIWFSYARVSLAMIMAFLGGSYLYKPLRSRTVSYILGLTLLSCSIFFHKTAFFAIALILIAFIGGFIYKRMFGILIFALLIVAPYYLSSFFTDFMTLDLYDDSILAMSVNYGQYYLDGVSNKMGIGEKLRNILEMIPYYLLAIMSFVRLWKYDVIKDVAINMRIIIIIVVFSSLLYFNDSLNTLVLYVRFMRFAFIPASIVLAYLWNNDIYMKITKATFYIALSGSFYAVLYSLYCGIVG